MRLKILFIVGLGVGYVLGARAGRPRFEQIRSRATEAWEDPRVQKVVTDAQDFVKETAPIVQEKVVAGTKAAVVGAQDAAAHVSDFAKDVTEKVVETTRDVSAKVIETTRDVSGHVAETSKSVTESVVKSTKDASEMTKDASRKVAKSAKKASKKVTKTAKEVRDRLLDRGEEVVAGVITAAGTARDDALALESDDEKSDDEK